MKFVLEIEMDNAAFENYPTTELCALLEKTKRQVNEFRDVEELLAPNTEGQLLDHNGNSCAAWRIYA
jgi:hypothetical protein